jgi:hypothetical protein
MTEPVAHETFDPYHKWMGIAPRDQPPHYYRLLAIDLFESDTDVISAAADKQMAFIRSFQTGKNAGLSQKILNEIATARVCLLNAAKKAAYDGILRARMAAATESGDKGATPIPVVVANKAGAESANLEVFDPLPLQFDGSVRSQIRKRKAEKTTILPLLMALGAMLVICAIAIVLVMSRPPEHQVSQAAEDPPGSPPRDAAAPRVKPAQDKKSPMRADAGRRAPPRNSNGGLESNDSTDAAKRSNAGEAGDISENNSQNNPSGEHRPDTKARSGNGRVASKSAPVPEPETPAKPAEADKRKTPEEFDKQLAEAKTPEAYQALAVEALRTAGKAVDDHQEREAKELIRKALIAARKSGGSKLIFRVTRAMTKPESVKEILDEMGEQDEKVPADGRPAPDSSSRPRDSSSERSDERPASPDR